MRFLFLTRDNLPRFKARLEALAPDTPRRWGGLTPHRLLAHLRRTLEISLGEYAGHDRSIPVLSTLLRWLTFNTPIPWPKGRIKAPPDWTPEPQGSFQEERAWLFGALDRFIEAAERDPARRGLSPLFGPLPLATWRRIHGRHFEHHFQQFGL